MKAYTRQGLPNYFEKAGKKTIDALDKQELRDHSYYLKKYLFHQAVYSHPNTETLTTTVKSQKEMIDSIDDFFYLDKLKQQLELQLRKNFVKENRFVPELNMAIQHAKKSKRPEFLFLVEFIKLVSVKKFKRAAFKKVKKIFEENISLWNKREQRQLLQFLINYITNFLNQGNDKLTLFQVELFELGLQHDVFLNHNKIMTHPTFTNLVTIFIHTDLKEKALAFIKQNSKYLDPSVRADAVLFAKGYIAMSEKEYASAVNNLSQLSKKSEVAKLQVTCYLLRSSLEEYLENREYNSLLLSHLKRYETYFKGKNPHSEERKNGFQILGSIVRRFYNILKRKNQSPQDYSKLSELKTEVAKPNNNFPMKPWILRKIVEEQERRGK